MRSDTLVLGVVVSALLLAGAGVLYSVTDNGGARHYRTCIDLVRQIQQLSSSWSIEIARVRANPLADFDALAAFSPQMGRLKRALSETTQLIPEPPKRLLDAVTTYVNAVDAKEKHIERFKTTYAVVRNSTRYLPLVTTNVMRQAQVAGDESLVQIIGIVSRDMHLYLSTPAPSLKARLSRVLDELRQASVGYAPSMANALANLVTHMEVLLSRQEPMNTLFQKATTDEATELGNRLSRDLEFHLHEASMAAAYYRNGLVAVVVLLVMFWVVLVVQRRARTRVASLETGGWSTKSSEPAAEAMGNEPRGLVARAGPIAESAILYDFLIHQAGDYLVSLSRTLLERIDSLRQIQQRIHFGLQSVDPVPALPGGGDLGEEFDTGRRIAALLHRDVNGIVDFANRLASYSALPSDAGEHATVDVNACIDEVVEATGMERAAAVSRRYNALPEIRASRTELRLLLAQVLANSVQAVEQLEDREAAITINTSSTRNRLSITIFDNGPGISPERQKNIFKPFHATRDNAMGIGLAMAGDLVRRNQGTIKVRSLLGQGTMIRITLPTSIQPANSSPSVRSALEKHRH